MGDGTLKEERIVNLSFRELEDCLVWENDEYVCYEIHKLIYTDL